MANAKPPNKVSVQRDLLRHLASFSLGVRISDVRHTTVFSESKIVSAIHVRLRTIIVPASLWLTNRSRVIIAVFLTVIVDAHL
jgi:hypothetical protein